MIFKALKHKEIANDFIKPGYEEISDKFIRALLQAETDRVQSRINYERRRKKRNVDNSGNLSVSG